jgi:hypothetical protein
MPAAELLPTADAASLEQARSRQGLFFGDHATQNIAVQLNTQPGMSVNQATRKLGILTQTVNARAVLNALARDQLSGV